MKKMTGEELAKEIGCGADALKKTCQSLLFYHLASLTWASLTDVVDNHNHYAKNPGTDPFKKKVHIQTVSTQTYITDD